MLYPDITYKIHGWNTSHGFSVGFYRNLAFVYQISLVDPVFVVAVLACFKKVGLR